MLFYRTPAFTRKSEEGNYREVGEGRCIADPFRVSLLWCGGALGFDTLCAKAILRLRQSYPGIKLILVLPCVSQADRWRPEDRTVYREIMEQADKVVYTSQEYTRDCMFKRNRHLVDNSSVCICYQTKATGGTAYTVEYARKHGLRIINLAEE